MLPAPSTLVQFQSHIFFVHGVWVSDVHTVEGMIEAHDACHTTLPNGQRWDNAMIRHQHGPSEPTGRVTQEWTW